MRLILIAAGMIAISASACMAGDPRQDSVKLYQRLAALGPQLIEMVASSNDEPQALADRIKVEVQTPVTDGLQDWMDGAYNNGESSEPYLPYRSCFDAGFALSDLSVRFRRYLQGDDKQPVEAEETRPFVVAIDACAVALGLPPSGLGE